MRPPLDHEFAQTPDGLVHYMRRDVALCEAVSQEWTAVDAPDAETLCPKCVSIAQGLRWLREASSGSRRRRESY
jgi:hypothetical protein